ncbi:tetratricopeptide repeat protein [Fictibacillus phosphorivorans]|uniref:tetratricopeptide repeat protein n=1 Tax=Fictibacillus phosphorivorans TaxID=1221500 RepID=UPI00203CE14B|nr:tetratricopeptide repeat protein [Fictibacillus phosphorivorans]MCM3718922.1 tetratricopeptide repeat protein [Fictibacillus phosphorivorans]MCM3776544.1 tetratricopeptide repeat protein [Fictibacillus phosphorivorans]
MNTIQDAIRLVEHGDVEKGMSLLEQLEHDAKDAEQFEIAELYLDWGHTSKAMNILNNMLKKYPGEGELLVSLAECYLDEGMDEEAISYLEQVDQNDEEYLRALILQADLYEGMGLTEVAERKLKDAYQKDTDHPVLSYALGDFYLRQGKFDSSLPLFQNAIDQQGEIEDLPLKYAEALSRAGKFEEALPLYRKGLEHHKDLYSMFGHGVTAFKAGEFKEAISVLEELKDMDPDYTTLYSVLSESYEEEGALEEAYQVIQDGLKRDEHNENIYLQAARLAYKMHYPEQGEEWVKKALELNPALIEPLLRLGDQYLREERYEDIISLYKPLAETKEEIPLMYWHLATAHKETEKFKEAFKWYEKAAQLFQDDPVFLEEYAYFLLEEGEQGEAKNIMRAILKKNPERADIEEALNRLEEF